MSSPRSMNCNEKDGSVCFCVCVFVCWFVCELGGYGRIFQMLAAEKFFCFNLCSSFPFSRQNRESCNSTATDNTFHIKKRTPFFTLPTGKTPQELQLKLRWVLLICCPFFFLFFRIFAYLKIKASKQKVNIRTLKYCGSKERLWRNGSLLPSPAGIIVNSFKSIFQGLGYGSLLVIVAVYVY